LTDGVKVTDDIMNTKLGKKLMDKGVTYIRLLPSKIKENNSKQV